MRWRFLVPGLIVAAIAYAGQTNPSKTIWSGVYSAEQATRGEAQFETHRMECHAGDLNPQNSASRLVGERFMDRWRDEKLGYLFNFVSTSMPRRAPASLTESVYLDIVSFLMRSNQFPAGSEPLTKAAVENIQFERKDGPKPLPGNSLVQLVGCLEVDPDETFFLRHATEPARSRQSAGISAEEAKTAQAKPLGTGNFRLTNFEYLGDFRRLDHLGNKLFVKGTLIRQTNRDRISLTAVKVLDTTCEP